MKNPFKKKMSPEELEHLRHTLAHLLAAAVMELYPNTKRTLGPAVDNGFYYDFEFEHPISDKDLPKIEKRMREILKTWKDFEHREVSVEEAKREYIENPYKLEMIDEIAEKGEQITFYKIGNFEDLCRGGHTEVKKIKPDAFKLDRLAGAYWRGDEKNKMLTRIYGLAFENKDGLKDYLKLREEAERRDHRKLGKELDLFVFSDLVGSGLPLFTPRGTLMRDLVVEKIQKIQEKHGYQKVTIPHITKKELYMTSGHWEKFGDDLFHVKGASDTQFVIKPMNCPHHTQIFASKLRSYKELPLRYMEATAVYRDEQAGELLGLSRVRSITQDDAHVFCRPDQIKQEVKNIISVVKEFYGSLGMWEKGTYRVALSTWDPNESEKYLGNAEIWEASEKALAEAAKDEGIKPERIEGDAAFYGPKLDFLFKDALGREWQLATAQLDYNMPKRFGLEYVDKDGSHQTPVMIHRAVAGSLERFLSVIIEHFAGNFPVWMSPVQVRVLPITDTQKKFAEETLEKLLEAGLRAEIDDSSETLGKKIRAAKVEKVPYFLVIGEKEMEKEEVMVESRDDGQVGAMNITKFLELIEKEK